LSRASDRPLVARASWGSGNRCYIDLAMIDVFLRNRENALGLSRELSEAGVSILFATGNPKECEAHRRWAVGCIQKPFGWETIRVALDVVERVRDGKPLPSQVPPGITLYR
jgi:hypothetical protein